MCSSVVARFELLFLLLFKVLMRRKFGSSFNLWLWKEDILISNHADFFAQNSHKKSDYFDKKYWLSLSAITWATK